MENASGGSLFLPNAGDFSLCILVSIKGLNTSQKKKKKINCIYKEPTWIELLHSLYLIKFKSRVNKNNLIKF